MSAQLIRSIMMPIAMSFDIIENRVVKSTFVSVKRLKNLLAVQVPIVTRKVSTWSTPAPRNRKVENYDAWTAPSSWSSSWGSQTKPPPSKTQLTHPKGLQEKFDRCVEADCKSNHMENFSIMNPELVGKCGICRKTGKLSLVRNVRKHRYTHSKTYSLMPTCMYDGFQVH